MQHRHQKENKNEISFFNDVFHSPANGCVTKSNYKYNTVKHLKMFTDLKKKKDTVANNKVCLFCSKVFAQKPNCKTHVNIVHNHDLGDNIAFDEFDNQHDKQ